MTKVVLKAKSNVSHMLKQKLNGKAIRMVGTNQKLA